MPLTLNLPRNKRVWYLHAAVHKVHKHICGENENLITASLAPQANPTEYAYPTLVSRFS